MLFKMQQKFLKFISLSSTYAIGNIAQQAISLILLPIYTSYLSVNDYGVLALLTVTVSLFTKIIISPISSALGRFFLKPDYKNKSDIFLFNLFVWILIKTLIVAVLYFELSHYISQILFEKQYEFIIRIYTLFFIFTILSSFLLNLIRLLKKAKFYIFISLTSLLLTSSLTLYFLIQLELGLLGVIYSNIIGLLYLTLMCIPCFLKHSKFKFKFSILKEPLKYGYPLIIEGYSNLLIQSGDRYILKLFCSLSSVGLYSLGYKISSIMNILLVVPIKHALMPLVYEMENNPEEQKQFLISAATYYYIVAMYLSLFLSLFSKEVTMLLIRNPEYLLAWTIVPIISFSYVQHGLGNFLGWGIIMKNKSTYLSGILIISALVNIGLNFVFIPLWGLLGAAFATLLSYIVWNILKAYFSAQLYDLHFELKRLCVITIIGLGLYAISLFISTYFGFWITIISKICLLLFYPIFFYLIGFFSEPEKVFFIRNLKIIRECARQSW